MRAKLRVAIADDHQIMVEGLKSLLSREKSIHVVATAYNGEEAVKICLQQPVDIIILDISMPKINGIEAAKLIRKKSPHTKTIILSMHNDRFYLQEALAAGAKAFILKDSAFSEILRAIRALKRKLTYFSPKVAELIVHQSTQKEQNSEIKLTPRELQILRLIASGHSGREIAQIMKISYKTVDNHRQSLKRKLKVQTLTELTGIAIQKKLIDQPAKSNSEHSRKR